MQDIKRRLYLLIKREAFFKKKVKLASGKISNYYFDLRRITLNPEGSFLVAELIFDFIKKKGFNVIGGPTIGADPIVSAVVILSYLKEDPIRGFLVRKVSKDHGLMRQIEGPIIDKGDKIILVDDVATSGGSLLEAREVLRKEDIKIDSAMVILDREEGAKKNLKTKGIKLYSLFKASDFI